MKSEKYDDRPMPSTPYERLRWQQANCTEKIVGYAVVLATEATDRAAYMTGDGTELTNNEALAAILPKPEAATLMCRFHESEDWLAHDQFKIAFLVPMSEELPLGLCTFSGH